MHQRHYAGKKLFVDYAGRTVPIYGASPTILVPDNPRVGVTC